MFASFVVNLAAEYWGEINTHIARIRSSKVWWIHLRHVVCSFDVYFMFHTSYLLIILHLDPKQLYALTREILCPTSPRSRFSSNRKYVFGQHRSWCDTPVRTPSTCEWVYCDRQWPTRPYSWFRSGCNHGAGVADTVTTEYYMHSHTMRIIHSHTIQFAWPRVCIHSHAIHLCTFTCAVTERCVRADRTVFATNFVLDFAFPEPFRAVIFVLTFVLVPIIFFIFCCWCTI